MNIGSAIGYLELDTSKFQSKLKVAQSQFSGFIDNTQTASDRFANLGNSLKTVGSSLTKSITAPLVGIGAIAAKSAVDFESAFAGVKKTVDATDEELAKLEKGIRSLAKEMPTAATEIAGVAEAAGQLGIHTDNILGFTKAMVMLGDSTNMNADEAATSLARLANITGMSQKDFDKLGSTIVALGNNLATTEREITDMGLRLAGAGAQVGMSEAQILSFAGALSSVGIEAEAGGSAFSKVMIQMQLATEKGGDSLKSFADVAGMSSQAFKTAFEKDATTAIMAFIQGLGEAEEKGESAIGILDDMEIKEVRLRDALLRAAGASDVFADAVNIGTNAWKENTALTNEATQRYETLASKMEIMKNKLTDVGIEIGQAIMPHLEKLVTKIGEMADWFGSLDKGTQSMILAFAAFAAAIGPSLMVIGQMALGVSGLIKAFDFLKNIVVTNLIPAISKLWAFFMANPITLVIAAVTALVGAFIYLWNNCEGFREFWINLWETVKTWTADAVESIVSWFEGLPGKLQVIWDGVKTAISDAWTAIGDFFTQTVPQWIDSIINWFNELPYKIGFALGELLANILVWGTDTWNYFSENVPLWIENISTWFSELPGKIWEWLSSCIEKISTWGTQTYTNAQKWATQTINTIGTWFSQLPSKIWQWLSQAIDRVKQFGKDMLQKGKEASSKTVDAIQNGFKNLPSKMLDIGKNVVKGLWNGISSMTSWIKSKISSFIDGIVAGFSSVFSKVSSKVNSGKRSIDIPNIENIEQTDAFAYSKALKARENTINDFASGMSSRVYTMFRNADIGMNLSAVKTNKSNNNNERPIEVNLNIDKFVNESKEDINMLMERISFELRKRKLSYGGARQ